MRKAVTNKQHQEEATTQIQAALEGHTTRTECSDAVLIQEVDAAIRLPGAVAGHQARESMSTMTRSWFPEAESVFEDVAKLNGGEDTITKDELVAAQGGDFKTFEKINMESDDGEVTREEFLQFLCDNEDTKNGKKHGKGTKWLFALLHTLATNMKARAPLAA